jgi:hypothetical protein
VREEREGDDDGLGNGGLVVWSREEEEAIRFTDRARGQWYYGSVCDVKGGEDTKCVRGVLLYPCY